MEEAAGWLKCIVNATTFVSRGKVSFGGVLRYYEGKILAAKCACLPGRFSAHDAEALVVREILSWIKDL